VVVCTVTIRHSLAWFYFMEEIWRDIKGFEGKYQISSLGNARSLYRWRICDDGTIKTQKGRMLSIRDAYGYKYFRVYINGKRKNLYVHKELCRAFKEDRDRKNMVVNHIDGDKGNNDLDNLEWCTKSEDVKHAYKMGLVKWQTGGVDWREKAVGERHPRALLTTEKVIEIRKLRGTMIAREIAKLYNVSESTIKDVLLRSTWRHVQ